MSEFKEGPFTNARVGAEPCRVNRAAHINQAEYNYMKIN